MESSSSLCQNGNFCVEKPRQVDIRTCPLMFGLRKNKEAHRFYLLPGMGRSNRRHHWQVLRWTLIFGALFSALFGYLIYMLNRP